MAIGAWNGKLQRRYAACERFISTHAHRMQKSKLITSRYKQLNSARRENLVSYRLPLWFIFSSVVFVLSPTCRTVEERPCGTMKITHCIFDMDGLLLVRHHLIMCDSFMA